jgi:alpha/beta superfamily hydrolase
MSDDTGPISLRLTTSDDEDLEAEWQCPTVPPSAAVVLAHPHPAQGGNMRSLVTSELFRSLPALGVAVLRFNFRGVEGSSGTHGGGQPERADVVAAIDALALRHPDVPLVVSGWSFGADVSLGVDDPRISGWFAVAPPLRILTSDEFVAGADPRPKHLAVPEHDQFNPPDRCRRKVEHWVETSIAVVAGADHFLVGRTQLLAKSVATFSAALRR